MLYNLDMRSPGAVFKMRPLPIEKCGICRIEEVQPVGWVSIQMSPDSHVVTWFCPRCKESEQFDELLDEVKRAWGVDDAEGDTL